MSEEKYSTNLLKTKYVDDSKITDHYCLTPTGQGYENYDALPDVQKKVYKLIVKRFLQIFYPPAEFSKLNIVVDVSGEKFYASTRVCIVQGYLDVAKGRWAEKEETSTEDEENVEKDSTLEAQEKLAKIKKEQEVEVKNYEIKESETTPPTRYNSGSMILAMENAGKLIEDEALREQIKGAGIGTSATRAGIIEKLERIKYIQINNKTKIITPTEKGEKIYDIVFNSMPDMLNPKLTASWEKGLDMVAKDEIKSDEFMTKLINYVNSKFNKLIVKR
jgi:DNA topoisomerase-3